MERECRRCWRRRRWRFVFISRVYKHQSTATIIHSASAACAARLTTITCSVLPVCSSLHPTHNLVINRHYYPFLNIPIAIYRQLSGSRSTGSKISDGLSPVDRPIDSRNIGGGGFHANYLLICLLILPTNSFNIPNLLYKNKINNDYLYFYLLETT